MFVEKEKKFSTSLNSRVPPLTDNQQKDIRQKVSDYVQIAVEEEKDRIEKAFIKKHGTRRGSVAKPAAVSWKRKMAGTYDENDNDTFDRSKFIWDAPETADFLTREQATQLTERIRFVLDKVESEREFKYLQLRMILSLIDQLISQVSAEPNDMRKIRKLVGLKVFKKNYALQ